MPVHRLQIPDATGHSTLEFDTANPEQLATAQAKFDALIAEGQTAGKRVEGKPNIELIRSFDPNAEETVFSRRVVGG